MRTRWKKKDEKMEDEKNMNEIEGGKTEKIEDEETMEKHVRQVKKIWWSRTRSAMPRF